MGKSITWVALRFSLMAGLWLTLGDVVHGQAYTLEPVASGSAEFVTWAPHRYRLKTTTALTDDQIVVLTNDSPNPVDAGDLQFAAIPSGGSALALQDTLTLMVPKTTQFAEFYLAGKEDRPSSERGDAKLLIHLGAATAPASQTLDLMVRVRKNAKNLTSGERTRFLQALATVSAAATSPTSTGYSLFQGMHSQGFPDGYLQAHRQPGFPAWHRAMVLHLERELQKVDSSVTLPYWDWHDADSSKAIFNEDFLGRTVTALADPSGEPQGSVIFAATNPLELVGWPYKSELLRNTVNPFQTTAIPTVDAASYSDITLPSAYVNFQFGGFQTDAMGNIQVDPLTGGFLFTGLRLEQLGHDNVHGWVGGMSGQMSNPDEAVKDPTFFLLHTNVDREWAIWQKRHNRFNASHAVPATAAQVYFPSGAYFANTSRIRIGHFRDDKLWPWSMLTGNQGTANPDDDLPTWADRRLFPQTSGFGPSNSPRVGDTVDYLGKVDESHDFGYCYDKLDH